MTIRDQAWAAYLASRSDVIVQHEAGLRQVLDGLTVDLEHVDVRVSSAGVETFYFSDGDVTLAARQQSGSFVVSLAESDVQGWRLVAEVGSLAELGPLVPPQVPDDVPVADWVSGNLYGADAIVAHDGKTWRSTVDSNSWEPGVAHSVWVLA